MVDLFLAFFQSAEGFVIVEQLLATPVEAILVLALSQTSYVCMGKLGDFDTRPAIQSDSVSSYVSCALLAVAYNTIVTAMLD